MTVEIQIAPPNSLLAVMDLESGELPESIIPDQLVNATPSCAMVGTMMFVDEETAVMLTDDAARIQQIAELYKVYRGPMATPRKVIQMCTVDLEAVLTLAVSSTGCMIEIWANDDREPDRLCVFVEPSA